LGGKEHFSELVETTDLCGESEGIICSYRLLTEEAAHAIFDAQLASVHSCGDGFPIEFLELSTIGTLGILEKDHPTVRVGVADKHAAFGSVPGGNG
jgi:hypothetical protein